MTGTPSKDRTEAHKRVAAQTFVQALHARNTRGWDVMDGMDAGAAVVASALATAHDKAFAEGMKEAAGSAVEAWEKLRGGQQQSVRAVEAWLLNDMAPVINSFRAIISKAEAE